MLYGGGIHFDDVSFSLITMSDIEDADTLLILSILFFLFQFPTKTVVIKF